MRSEWFPATVHHPQTCSTFRLLETFHIVTLTGKLSAHEFYKSLEYLTDNTELDIPKVSWILVSSVRRGSSLPLRLVTNLLCEWFANFATSS